MDTIKTMLTVDELAERWQISKQTIYNNTHRKTQKSFPVKPVRIGRSVRFRLADILQAEERMAT